jgi:hypothetical protein
MSDNILDLRMDAAFEEQIKNASFEEIKEMMIQRAVDLGIFKRENDPSILTPVEQPATAPRKAKSITVNSVTKVIEGADDAEVTALELEYLRSLATTSSNEKPRSPDGRFTAEHGRSDENAARAEEADAAAEIIRKSNLELAFKRGEISASDYIDQSGAVASYLEKQGVPIDELKAQVEEKSNKKYEAGWEAATKEFLATTPGWPGGDENRDLVGALLIEMHAEHHPSVENMRIAYEHLRKNGLLVENPETTAIIQQKMGLANSVEEIRALRGGDARTNEAVRSSGYFGGN